MTAALSCPVCRIALGEGETHCPRCRLRVAALPRRQRAPRDPAAPPGPLGRLRDIPAGSWPAARHGALIGVLVALAAAAVGVAVHLAGGSGTTVSGDADAVAAGVCLLVAATQGGLRVQRWAEYGQMRERVEATRRVGGVRVAMLAAAAVLVAAAGIGATLR